MARGVLAGRLESRISALLPSVSRVIEMQTLGLSSQRLADLHSPLSISGMSRTNESPNFMHVEPANCYS
jgi:hypothetical protein